MSDKNVIQSTVVLALASIEVRVGDICTVLRPAPLDIRDSAEYNAINGQQATVSVINDGSVDIKMATGAWVGKIISGVNTECLQFAGIYKHDKAVALGVTEVRRV